LQQSREVERSLRTELEAQTTAAVEEHRAHNNDVDRLKAMLEKSDAELRERNREIMQLKQTSEKLSIDKASLLAELEVHQEHVRSETAKHYSEIAQLEHALKCSSEAENTLRKNFEARMLSAHDEHSKKDDMIENLKKSLAQSTASESSLRTQMVALEAEKVKHDVELKQLQLSMSDSVETNNELQALVKSVTDEKQSYESELNQLRTTVNDQNAEIAIIKQQLATKSRYLASVSSGLLRHSTQLLSW